MDEVIKIFTVGNTDVGKTSILKKFIKDEFDEKQLNTQGLDFFITTINIHDKAIKFHLWDTAGQERYKGITTAYFRNAHGILLIFSIDSKKSFEQLDQWLQSIKSAGKKEIKLLLVGNKWDLTREVKEEDAKEFAQKNNMEYFETSAKTGHNIKEIFSKIGELVLSQEKEEENPAPSFSLKSNNISHQSERNCTC